MEEAIRDPFEDTTDIDDEEDLDIDDDLMEDEEDDTDADENGEDGDENGEEDEDEENGDGAVTLDALEAEELETVETNDPATILVDEASEIKALRREEMALDVEAEEASRGDEFVCRSCFLLLKMVQLSDPENMLCVDCA